MKQYWIILFAIPYIWGCNSQNDESSIQTIPIPELLEQKIELNFSDIWNKVSYIPLESDSGCYIKAIDRIVFDDEHILIHDKDSRRLMLFDNSGSYIEDFLTYGRGPNEFFEITSIDCNKNHEVLILRNGQFIDIMNFDRTVINTIKLTEATPAEARWLTDEIIVLFFPYPYYLSTNGDEICFIDRNGDVLKRDLKRKTKGVEPGPGSSIRRIGIIQNEMYYWFRYSDTVYTIKPTMEVFPRYIFKHDDRHIPYQEIIKNLSASYSDNKKYKVVNYYEWEDYIFLTIVYDRYYVRGVINQNRGIHGNALFSYDQKTYKYVYPGLLNDIDGGFPFWPTIRYQDGSVAKIVDPFRLRETAEFNKNNGFPMSSELHEKLQKEILSNLNIYSNPIIMRATQ